ncbi:asparaginase domain-containing protein [Desulfococcaceae bacterium HSG9]|nr:asparaginase domain-containing protein [Desulfococcaceae bacterium HSG9]
MLKIKIFAVGGTIDKVYFDAKSTYEVGPPNIAKVLEDLSLNIEYSITSILQKDSLDMDAEDRLMIFEQVSKAEEDRIIITHGTDTMVQTAEVLKQIRDKTIVLTGALEPAMFKTSDAVFNIGCAMAAVQTLPPNVYIAMNGRIFRHDNVVKDVENNRFVMIKGNTV